MKDLLLIALIIGSLIAGLVITGIDPENLD